MQCQHSPGVVLRLMAAISLLGWFPVASGKYALTSVPPLLLLLLSALSLSLSLLHTLSLPTTSR
jgi:hypothetical protein